MQVKLVAAGGESAGEEVPVEGSKFLIGRAQDCQLRPNSDLVSRHHCVIFVEEGFVAVRDFGSKNGTFVNGQMVKGEQELNNGDRLKVSDVEYEVCVDTAVGEEKQPESAGVPETAASAAEAALDDDLDLDSWLNDTQAIGSLSTESTIAETVMSATSEQEEAEPAVNEESEEEDQKDKKATDVVGVWSKGRWKPTAASPRDAAAETLKNFFRRR